MNRKLLIVTLMCVALSGCSARHWGGATTEQPGFKVAAGAVRVEATANMHAKADKLKLGEFEAENIEFGQDPAEVVKAEPAKLDAIARLQLTQVEYARVTWGGVRDLAAELVPVLKLLALAQFTQTETGLTATLPGGLTIGKHTLTRPAELQEFFRQAVATLEPLVPPDDTGSVPEPAPETEPAAGGDT